MPVLEYVIEDVVHENFQNVAIFPQHEKQPLKFFRGFRAKLGAYVPLKPFLRNFDGFRFRLLLTLAFQEIFNVEIGAKSLELMLILKQILVVIKVKLLDLFLGVPYLQLVDAIPLKF
jgi:hypothetical protein